MRRLADVLLAEPETVPMDPRITRRLESFFSALSPRVAGDLKLVRHAREYVVPNPPPVADSRLNMPATRLDPPGIDFREAEQLAYLASLRDGRHQAMFKVLREDAAINRLAAGRDVVSNIFCNTPDAEIYASMILDRRPRRVIEIGSGFSTLIAKKAIDFGGLPTELVVIDPNPRTDVRAVADRLNLAPVEQTGLLEEEWMASDILFIDSSHICRTRGDLPYLFCRLLPSLPPGVLVHVHDIFLPYDYPNLYDEWSHTEEYLLACTLSHSQRYRVVMATHWLSRTHGGEMEKTFGPYAGTEASSPDHFGCSFWFEVVGSH
jgi:hypothetical protein